MITAKRLQWEVVTPPCDVSARWRALSYTRQALRLRTLFNAGTRRLDVILLPVYAVLSCYICWSDSLVVFTLCLLRSVCHEQTSEPLFCAQMLNWVQIVQAEAFIVWSPEDDHLFQQWQRNIPRADEPLEKNAAVPIPEIQSKSYSG